MRTSKKQRFLTIILSFLLCLTVPLPASAFEPEASDTKEVVFLLDASGSMKTNDPNRYAIDSIAQLIYTLPSSYKAGFAAYNSEVCACEPLLENSQRSRIMDTAKEVSYAGYGNAGAGLKQAVELLSSDTAGVKEIVMLSDGEFLMESEEATENSRAMYREAVRQAVEQGITIHVIGLGDEMEDEENSIFQAARETGGEIFYSPQAADIQSFIDMVSKERLHIRQTTAAIVDTDGEMEHISIEQPFANASTIRVLLTSSMPIENLKTSFKAEDARQINGERYSLIEINRPKSEKLDLDFKGTAGGQVRITLIPEYWVTARADVSYEDRLPQDKQMSVYDREAEITYTFYDQENESIQLWTEEYFNHSRLSVQTESGTNSSAIEEGEVRIQRNVTKDFTEKSFIDFSEFPANVLSINIVTVEFQGPPALPAEEPEPEPSYLLYGILLLMVMAVLVIIAAVYRIKRNQPEPLPAGEERPQPGISSYVGKLNIYIARTPSGYDISPLAYDLFRLPSSRVLSVAEILGNCGVKEVFPGAERIYISSGQGRSLILTNQSDCCIMKSGEILMKQKSYQIFGESKVDIVFEDEVSELTLRYKDLKPSEMR